MDIEWNEFHFNFLGNYSADLPFLMFQLLRLSQLTSLHTECEPVVSACRNKTKS